MRLDNELERAVHDWLEATVGEPSRTVLTTALEQVEVTPQRRHRWLGRWFDRGGGATRSAGEHGTQTDEHSGRNRHMAILSTVTASAAALVVALILIIPRAGPVTDLLPGASTGVTHVVAADGSGQFTSIGAAVAAATDGDNIVVRPGEYAEALVIDKDINVQGEGEREQIVISFLEGSAPVDLGGTDAYFPVVLRGFDGTFGGLTVRAPAQGAAVMVNGGAPQLHDLWLSIDAESYGALAMGGKSRPVVRGSLIDGDLVTDSDGTSPTLEGNTFSGGLSLNGPGEATVRGNAFRDGGYLSASDGLTALVEGNTFIGGRLDDPWETAVGIDTQADVIVRDNEFSGRGIGVAVAANGTATIEANDFADTEMAVTWSSTRGGAIERNAIRGGRAGIAVIAGSPSISANLVEDVSASGISVGQRAHAVIDGNEVCGCGTNLWIEPGSDSVAGENDVCADGGAA